jgi:leader peptidase (prepilin peptidase) / N-methyltransferase
VYYGDSTLADQLGYSPLGWVAVVVLALASVSLTVAFGPRLVAAFEPYEGEPVRRKVPSRLTLGIGTALAAAAIIVDLGCAGIGMLPAYLYLTVVGVVLAAVDLRVHRLPDAIVLPSYPILAALLAVAAVVDHFDWGDWDGERALSAGTGAAFLLVVFGLVHLVPRSGLGLGDVKLAGLLGAALGWPAPGVLVVVVPMGLLLSILSAGVWALFLLVTRRARRTDPIAYGPHLLLGSFLALLVYPGPILYLY